MVIVIYFIKWNCNINRSGKGSIRSWIIHVVVILLVCYNSNIKNYERNRYFNVSFQNRISTNICFVTTYKYIPKLRGGEEEEEEEEIDLRQRYDIYLSFVEKVRALEASVKKSWKTYSRRSCIVDSTAQFNYCKHLLMKNRDSRLISEISRFLWERI